jgi:hypothetical protein
MGAKVAIALALPAATIAFAMYYAKAHTQKVKILKHFD